MEEAVNFFSNRANGEVKLVVQQIHMTQSGSKLMFLSNCTMALWLLVDSDDETDLNEKVPVFVSDLEIMDIKSSQGTFFRKGKGTTITVSKKTITNCIEISEEESQKALDDVIRFEERSGKAVTPVKKSAQGGRIPTITLYESLLEDHESALVEAIVMAETIFDHEKFFNRKLLLMSPDGKVMSTLVCWANSEKERASIISVNIGVYQRILIPARDVRATTMRPKSANWMTRPPPGMEEKKKLVKERYVLKYNVDPSEADIRLSSELVMTAYCFPNIKAKGPVKGEEAVSLIRQMVKAEREGVRGSGAVLLFKIDKLHTYTSFSGWILGQGQSTEQATVTMSKWNNSEEPKCGIHLIHFYIDKNASSHGSTGERLINADYVLDVSESNLEVMEEINREEGDESESPPKKQKI